MIINVLYPPIVFGGAENSVALLAVGLATAGHDVTVISLHDKKSKTTDEIDGVTVYRLPIDNVYWPYGSIEKRALWQRIKWHIKDIWNSRARERVAAIIKEVKPEVVHTNNLRGLSVSVWAAARQFGVPVVHSLRDYSMICIYGGMFKSGRNCQTQCIKCRLFSAIRRRESNKVNFLASNSQSVLARHQNAGFFSGVTSRVIFNIGRSPMAEFHSVTDSTVLSFGYIGRIEPMKGIEIVLQAVAKLRPGGWKLIIAGRGNEQYEAKLKQKFERDDILWLGFVDQKQFYSSIDVCIVPSIWEEPLPRALLECFSYQKSAICSAAGGNLEAAALGRQVATYPANDVGALTTILSEAIKNPAKWKVGGFVSDEAEKEISEDSVVGRYLDAYRLAIASSHSAD